MNQKKFIEFLKKERFKFVFLEILKKTNPTHPLKEKRGMTLIELMISLVILTTLSITVFRFSYRSLMDRSKLEKKINDRSKKERVRKLIMEDIYQALDFRDINLEIYNEVMKKGLKYYKDRYNKMKKKKDSNQGLTEWEKFYFPEDSKEHKERLFRFEEKTSKPLTHFIGKKNFLHFTSTHNRRTLRDSASSNIVEIGYFLKKCKSLKQDKTYNSCLWRRLSLVLDDDVSKGGSERVILERVKKFELFYTEKVSQDSKEVKVDWKDEWRSDFRGDSSTRKKFPLAVMVSLIWEEDEKIGGQKKSKDVSLHIVAPLMRTLNLMRSVYQGKEKEKN